MYVDPERARPGDGSLASPVRTVAEALALRPRAGAIIAVAPGILSEFVHIRARFALVGMCASETRVELPVRQDELAVVFLDSRTGARAANLTLRGRTTGVSIHGPGVSSLSSLLIDRPEGSGVIGWGGPVELDHVVVRGTAASDGSVVAPAFGLIDVPRAVLRNCVADHPGGSGLVYQGRDLLPVRATLIVEDFVAVGHTTGIAPPMSLGVGVAGKVHLQLRRALIEGYRTAAVSLGAEQDTLVAATADMEDIIARGHDRRLELIDGAGISVREGSEATLRRVRIDDAPAHGFSIGRSDEEFLDRTCKFTGEDLLLRRGASGYSHALTHGFAINQSTAIALARVVILDQQGFGMFTTGTGVGLEASVRGDDLVIEGLVARPGDPASASIAIGLASSFDGERIRIKDSENFGFVAVSGRDSQAPEVRIKDVSIDGIHSNAGREAGAALAVTHGSNLAMTRGRIGPDTFFAVYLMNELGSNRSIVHLTDVDVVGSGSFGVESLGDVGLVLTRVAVRGAHVAGIGATGVKTPNSAPWVTGSDVLVEGTFNDNKGRFGVGLLSAHRAVIDLGRVELRDNRESAAYVARGASLFLTEASLSGTRFPDCALLPEADTFNCLTNGAIHAGGGGMTVTHGSTASIVDFVIEGNEGVGFYARDDSIISVHRGRIEANGIGIDLSGLAPTKDQMRDVRVAENGVDISKSSMSPPDPGLAIKRLESLGAE